MSAFTLWVSGLFNPVQITAIFSEIATNILSSKPTFLYQSANVGTVLGEFSYGYPILPLEAQEKINKRKNVGVAGFGELAVFVAKHPRLVPSGRIFALGNTFRSAGGEECFIYVERLSGGKFRLGSIFASEYIGKDDRCLLTQG